MRGLDELMLTGLLGDQNAWTRVAALTAFAVAVIFRSASIRRPTPFRWACTLLGLSILVPPVLNVACILLLDEARYGSGFDGSLLFVLPSAAGAVLLGFSLMAFFAALAPLPVPPPRPETKGPFD